MSRVLLGLVPFAGLLGALGAVAPAAPQAPAVTPDKIIATFSIAAVDPETGVCGAAVASMYPAVAKTVVHVRADVGAFCTQHYGVTKWGNKALDLLEAGKSCEEVIVELLREDNNRDGRQLAVIDRKGRSALHHPTGAPKGSNYWGGMSGRFYTCQGNTLTGREVITAMSEAYEKTKGSLADRLMAALVAGDCAGGDHRGRLAAGMRLAKKGVEGYWMELYVDRSKDAVVDLLRAYTELQHEAKGDWAGGQKPFKHPCADRVKPKPPQP